MTGATRRSRRWFAVLSMGLLVQSACPLQEDFDLATLFAESASIVFRDTIFFTLDSLLLSLR